ncbi:glycosyltransferase family 4 protein [Pedobacter sp.]|uniref:glycosyltransferase family 4 protein n=1 Tax=Pedobacter sp. TaxID=1411316 RepID=UPI003D7FE199
MLNILYDHQTFSLQRYGGISRYFANLHHETLKQEGINSSISILYSNNHYIQDSQRQLNKSLGKLLLHKQKKVYKWNEKYSRYMIGGNDFDVLHPTYYNPYFLQNLKKPFVLTVHDMIHEKFPDYFDTGDNTPYHKRLCIEKANHIIAISESTKNDIQLYHKIPESKISVVHHGFEPLTHEGNPTANSQHQNFLLYIGDRRSYKNFFRLLMAIAPLLKKDTSLRLICAGGGALQCAEMELILRLNILNQVIQVTVTDHELANLYRNAIAFLYPSIDEGFGLPLLEAFQYNCPVVASDIACFKEVGQDAISYFNPYDEQNMRTVIEDVLINKETKINLVKAGQKRLSNLTMKNCLELTINIYKNIAQCG